MALATTRRTPEPPSLNDVYEGERQLVGIILPHPEVYPAVAWILRGEDWTQSLHRGVFEVAGELAAAGQTIAPDSVLPRVSDVGPDGTPAETYLAGWSRRLPHPTTPKGSPTSSRRPRGCSTARASTISISTIGPSSRPSVSGARSSRPSTP
ncbi:DnaB-like helicase N-terminal domain-containing protein [Methylobacterium radiodurans]|uniref:DnaB-like helicase N-terminal domain-containing protein n=1 Tax=Methylobacterium radiodurans TaxID=2202828 RepID=UPI003CCC7928